MHLFIYYYIIQHRAENWNYDESDDDDSSDGIEIEEEEEREETIDEMVENSDEWSEGSGDEMNNDDK